MSARLKEAFGYGDDEVPSRSAWLAEIVFPEDLALARSNFEKHCADPAHPYDQILRYRHKDGSTVWIRSRGVALRDASGKPTRMLGAHTDITAWKRTEDEERIHYIADSLPQLVWTARPDGPCSYLNARWVAYTGAPLASQLGYGWLEHVHPADREAVKTRWDHAVASGEDFASEFRIRRHDGVYRWFESRATRVRDARGTVTKWFGSCSDIQDQREANETLQREVALRTRELAAKNAELTRNGAFIQTVIDAIPGPVGYWDTELRCRFANHAYFRWFGKTREEMLGATLRDVLGDTLYAQNEPCARAALRGESQEFVREITRPDGTVGDTLIHYLPHVEDGIVQGFVVLATDISERLRAQRVIETMNETLEQRVRERTKELRASEERFAKAFLSGPVALSVGRVRDRRIVEVNDQFVALTGYRRHEVLGRTPLEFGLDTEDRVRDREALLAAHRAPDGSVHNLEIPFATKSGEVRTALASLERIDFGDEGPCVLSTFIDITERKLAERRLAMQQTVGRVLAEAASLAEAAPRILQTVCEAEGWEVGTLWEARNDEGLLRCVHVWHCAEVEGAELAAFTRTLTFAKGRGAPGRVWVTREPKVILDIAVDEDFPRAPFALRAGLNMAIAFPIMHGDAVAGVIDFIGAKRPADPQLGGVLEAVGRQMGLFLERTRAAETVRRSEERLQSVIENLSEGLILASIDGTLLHWNPAALAMHGFTQAQGNVRNVAELLSDFALATIEGTPVPFADWPVQRILRGESLRDHELRIRRLDTDWERVFSYRGSLVSQPDGSKLVVLTINDITERMRRDEIRRLSETLTEDNQRIREANRLKSEFLANMSHELRTPLNAIIGFASLLHSGKAGPLADEQKEYLGDVLSSSRHLLQLINDVLDLAKVEAGHVDVLVDEVDPKKIVNEVKDILRGLAAAKKLRVAVEVDPSLQTVTVDPRMMKQILYNYLSNAIKFTPNEGRVWVRVVPEDASTIRIEVEDTGIGISGQDMRRLFVEFQQLDAGTGKKYQGTGLGLALTKKLAEAQGGDAGALSTPGQGSRFFVTLPRVVVARGRREK